MSTPRLCLLAAIVGVLAAAWLRTQSYPYQRGFKGERRMIMPGDPVPEGWYRMDPDKYGW